ncbi:MAG: sorbosone dehydrogenase family protein, partial [Gammaproteobacteria bacterium]|nr:sorbosone dehydrogenase family protein [Gammaproteobacteria bacterium]
MHSRLLLLTLSLLAACGNRADLSVAEGSGRAPELPSPEPSLVPTVNIAPARGWSGQQQPTAADGLNVNAYARELEHPRWLYVLPNGDVLVAETNAQPGTASGGLRGWLMRRMLERAGAAVPSADRITLLRDEDGDGEADVRSRFLEDLNSPFGMTLVGDDFYVANTDALWRYRYEPGALRITGLGEKIADLPAGPINQHWTKNVIASRDGTRLFVTVGSNSNIGENGLENEARRAAILEIDPATGESRVFASGLRNPNGLDFEPVTGELWTTVNERDGLGSDLVPDYMTSVRDGGFYGWPYSYFGQTLDPRVEPERPDLVAEALVPDYALGPHTASLGLVFYIHTALPERYRGGAFVAQHGSWNRSDPIGYRVMRVRFDGAGNPIGKEVFIDGWLGATG